jgi:hypothetical protein
MVAHESIAAWPASPAQATKALIRAWAVGRLPYHIDAAENPQVFDPTDGGEVVPVITYLNKLFWYDAADTTTAHDGVSTLVTAGGERFKVADAGELYPLSVLDKDLNTPPGSPSIGDAYIVGPAPNWAANSDDIAIFTARSWEFITAARGRLVEVEDESASTTAVYYAWNGTAWVLALDPVDQEIVSSNLNDGIRKDWIVENQTTNTPPSVGQGAAYIIGSSPTGAWVGHTNKIAVREATGTGNTFVIYTPREGDQAWDKALDAFYIWDGTAWEFAGGVQSGRRTVFDTNDTWNKPGFGLVAQIEVWGGGGGAAATNGGGGGGYNEIWVALADLGATETVTIGAGGTTAAQGGNTTFGSWVTAFGGGGGFNGGGGGGGGGGAFGKGSNGSGGSGGSGGAGGGGAGGFSGAGVAASNWSGGGGGGSGSGAGGQAVGGGGGGGASGGSAAGGTSYRGGDGGQGGSGDQAVPGGGAGAGAGSNTGAGGRCIVTVY